MPVNVISIVFYAAGAMYIYVGIVDLLVKDRQGVDFLVTLCAWTTPLILIGLAYIYCEISSHRNARQYADQRDLELGQAQEDYQRTGSLADWLRCRGYRVHMDDRFVSVTRGPFSTGGLGHLGRWNVVATSVFEDIEAKTLETRDSDLEGTARLLARHHLADAPITFPAPTPWG